MFDLATFSVEDKVMLAGQLRRCGAGCLARHGVVSALGGLLATGPEE